MKGIAIIIIVGLVIMAFFYRVPYSTFPLDNPIVVCSEGELYFKNQGDQLSNIFAQSTADMSKFGALMRCTTEAEGDLSIVYKVICANNVPTVVCKTQLYKSVIMGKVVFIREDEGIVNSPKNNGKEAAPDYKSMCENDCGGNLKLDSSDDTRGKGYFVSDFQEAGSHDLGKHILFCSCGDGSARFVDLP